MDGDAIPVLNILLLGLDKFQLLFGVIDERAEFFLLALADVVAKELIHLTLDVARGILQNVAEGITLAVDIGQKMLGAFRQGHDSLKVDNLGRGIGNRGE